ncbi:RsmB/NOP family class I SAM-dependent RNA methyltransferase [Candidatus Woesearchaeota archaeon]|nr:RsmB/NOP family class I SAM-dependent RNA methyltransferase [Candidatus Woesearchaeota archaeon]
MKKIPGEIVIKEDFERRYRSILGEKYDEFMEHSTSFLDRSIRVNTLKIGVDGVKERLKDEWSLTQIPWCREGFWIKGKRLDIGNLSEHVLGYFYVQEAASMIPPIALDPRPGETILDLCAAPGSKTTQIAAMMENRGVLVANELSGERIKALGLNLNRSGITNVVITHSEGRQLRQIIFDRVLVDAPCSATGTVRRNLRVLQQYNYGTVKRLASIQKGLLRTAYNLLAENGVLVYSTCSMEPEEDEGVVDYLLEKEPDARLERIDLDIKRSPVIEEFDGKTYNPEVRKCLRLWPQDNNTEGFFVAKFLK